MIKIKKNAALNFFSLMSWLFFIVIGLVLGFGGMFAFAYCLTRELWLWAIVCFFVMSIGAVIINYAGLKLPE